MMSDARPRAVVLLSGGLDSTTTLAVALAEGYEVYALSVAYGQRHAVELEAAGRIAGALGVSDHAVVHADLARFGGSALTGDTPVPKDRKEPGRGIPVTYVPARNTVLLSLALAWAETLGTGDLFIGDVGQNQVEEIDLQRASSAGGENYGWSCMEGDLEVNFNPCDGNPLTGPILVYGHNPGCSVTGGFLYRGDIAGLNGRYVFGDFCSGVIWFSSESAGVWSTEVFLDTTMDISSFGEDDHGELFVLDHDGGVVYRFVSPSLVFADGFESADESEWSAAVGN